MQTKLDILINAKGEYQAIDESRKKVFALRAEIGALSSAIQAGAGLSIGAGLVSGLAAVPVALKNALVAGVAYNANIEKQSASFKILLGSATEATARMRELAAFAAATPFELPQLVQASRTLQTFGGSVLAAGAGLKLVGDASSAVNAPIAETSMWMGRLFAALRQGAMTGEAVQNLTQLGLISGETRNRLAALQGQALSEAAAMDVMNASFGRFSGAMAEQANTFEGLSSNLSDAFSAMRAEVSQPLFAVLKDSIKDVTKVISEEGFASGLKISVRMLADMASAGIEVATVISRFSDVLLLAAAAWAAVQIGKKVQGLADYVVQQRSAEAAELRLVAALETEVAALSAKQAAMVRMVDLQTRLNALQMLGNTSAGTANAWAPGVKGAAASDVLAQSRSIEGLNTALKAAPGLMSKVATGGRSLFTALGGWGMIAVAGVFAIDWWKSWRLEAIDAMDQVALGASSKIGGLRKEIAAINTELSRTVAISRVQTALAVANADPSKYSANDVQALQKQLEYLQNTSAADIAKNAQKANLAPQKTDKPAADPVTNIDTLLQQHEEAQVRLNRLKKEYNDRTAEQVLAERKAAEEAIAAGKAKQASFRDRLSELEAERTQLKDLNDNASNFTQAPGKIAPNPAGFMSQTKNVMYRADGGFDAISDDQAAKYADAEAFLARKEAAQAAVNASQAEYNRLSSESADIANSIAQTEASMPRAEKLDEYVKLSQDVNKELAEEAKKIAELQSERARLNISESQLVKLLQDEIRLGEEKLNTLGEGLPKEQQLLAVARQKAELQKLLDKQSNDELSTALQIAQIKQGAAQREREAIEKRRVDGKLTVADQKLLAGFIDSEKSAIDELIVAYNKLRTAKGVSEADKAKYTDTIAALNQEKDGLGKGTPQEKSRYEKSADSFGSMGEPQNSFQGPGEAVGAGLMDMANEAGTAWNNLHDSVMNVGQAMQSGIAGSLQGLIMKTMTWRQALSNIGTTILSSIVSSIATMFAKWVVGELMLFALRTILRKKEDAATKTSTGLKAAEGGMKSISQLGPIWGTLAFVGALAAIFALTSAIGSKATGGPISSGRPYLVGEYGPELVIPSESAVVMNHKETAAIADRLGGAGGGNARPGSTQIANILVDNRREADRFRRGATMETQIIEVSRRNRSKIFG